jgi:putative N6-adenine-specific DNA methylase
VTPLAWLATCPEDTTAVLHAELVALGATDPTPVYRGVRFTADTALAWHAHLALRTASRIQRILTTLPADTPAALNRAATTFAWPTLLRPDRPFVVTPVLTDEAARRIGEPTVRAAFVSAVAAAFPKPPRHDPEADHAVTLVPHLRDGVCTLGVDTSGRALHKRGWRLPGHPAVLKETLAATILRLADYDGTEPLLDATCGSGTLVIEAAALALGKAPLIHRGKDDFGFEHLADFDRALWRQVADTARARRLPEPPAPLFASDRDEAYVALARRGALRARVEKHIQFSVAPVQSLDPPAPTGLFLANLPYGTRIGHGEIEALYRDVGQLLRTRFAAWRVALLVQDDAPRGALNLRSPRSISLLNGSIPVRLLLAKPYADRQS